jgi:hypothetical protein
MHFTYYLPYSTGLTISGRGSKKRMRKKGELVFTKTFNYRYSIGNLMDVSVVGHRSSKLKDELAIAAEYYASLLLPRRICKNISLNIRLMPKLADDAMGYCSYVERDGQYKEFEIELYKKMSKEELLKYLAHEVVHMKQFALGELNDGFVSKRKARWQSSHIDENKVDYWDQPWEIEAYGREIGLYARYVETFGSD